jgi:hypothetical protein
MTKMPTTVRKHQRKGTKGVKQHSRSLPEKKTVPYHVDNDLPSGFRFKERDLGMGERKLNLLDKTGEEVGFIHYVITRDRETLFGDIEKGNIHFSYMEIYKDERKKGYSKLLLKKLNKIADKEKLDITLSARGRSLADYYKIFGFIETETIENSVLMRRKHRS